MNLYPNRFTAVLDACVLGGALRRDMLLSLAEAGLFRPRWSNRILDETERTILKMTKGNTNTRRQREEIERAFPEALVTGFEIFEDKLGLPDPMTTTCLQRPSRRLLRLLSPTTLDTSQRRCSNQTRLKPVQPMTLLRTPSTFIPSKPLLHSEGCANASTTRLWMRTLSFTRQGRRN